MPGHDRSLGGQMSRSAIRTLAARVPLRLYNRDGIASSPRQHGARPASGSTDPGHLAVGVPPLLHRAGLGACSCSGGWRGAGPGQAHRHASPARDGAGRRGGFPPLSRSAQPGALGRAGGRAEVVALYNRAAAAGRRRGDGRRRHHRAPLGRLHQGARHLSSRPAVRAGCR